MVEFLGATLHKRFAGHGVFKGQVVDFHRLTGYRIVYQDGDQEDVAPEKLKKMLEESLKLMPAHEREKIGKIEEAEKVRLAHIRNSGPKCVYDASVSLDEYIRAAVRGARRKRKHSELKRAGRLKPEPKIHVPVEESALRLPLVKPPSWAMGADRQARVVKCDSSTITTLSEGVPSLDLSLYQLYLQKCSATSVTLQWVYPPSNPGLSNAWIGLFHADAVTWHDIFGEVQGHGARLAWKGITRNNPYGVLEFSKLPAELEDGEYVFTLQRDYGIKCAAVSERCIVRDGRIVGYRECTSLITDDIKMQRKDRKSTADLGVVVKREHDTETEVEDERCYFPITSMEVTLGDYATPLLKSVYRVVDKESYLDWGLSSDYDSAREAQEFGDHRLRKREESADNAISLKKVKGGRKARPFLPPSMNLAPKQMRSMLGLGGGTTGSEGYGEATMGSVQKLGFILQNLRELVLMPLHPTGWGILWDLGPWSSFLDIGSGYGKVVLHLRLSARMRRSVGYECVFSRHQIGERAIQLLDSEALNLEMQKQGAESIKDSDLEADTVQKVPLRSFDGVELRYCDATKETRLPYTHIYIFDWVFSKKTLSEVAKVLQASPFYVMLSFHKCAEWWSYGLVKIQPVARMVGFRTTGNESMTCYVYINVEKIPSAEIS